MDEIVPMAPVNFFEIGADILPLPAATPYAIDARNFARFVLPDTSALCNETSFAEVALGWSKEGLEVAVQTADSLSRVELMIDTRDVKTSGYNTRFCHHFYFMPEAIDGVQAGELTRFRTEDTHELCDPKALQVKLKRQSQGETLHIFIPASCMHGYDPDQFRRMGFNYRLTNTHRDLQHFSVISGEFQIEQQPSLWASLSLSNSG
jgi:hypothetical protein